MDEQADFFSPNHNRLLNIAAWAKYGAWIVLLFFVLAALVHLFRYSLYANQVAPFQDSFLGKFMELVRSDAAFAIGVFVTSCTRVVLGFIWFLVLKAVSLGLNMIVETDINYREKSQGGDVE